MDVFAICGRTPAGYRIVRSSGTAHPTGTPVVITGGPGCTSTQPVTDTFSMICAA